MKLDLEQMKNRKLGRLRILVKLDPEQMKNRKLGLFWIFVNTPEQMKNRKHKNILDNSDVFKLGKQEEREGEYNLRRKEKEQVKRKRQYRKER